MAKYDISAGLSGAGSGAATGAALGSVIPGVGTAIGTGVGAVAGGLLGFFGSRKKKRKKISTLDNNQQGIYDQYSQGVQGQGSMADLFNFDSGQATDVFNKSVANPAYQNFRENVIPGITGQFRGGNLQNSSYLAGALGKAGTDVQRNLDAQLAQMLQSGQQNSIDRRIGAINNILGQNTFAYEKPQAGPMDSILGGFAQGAGNFAGQYFGNKLFGAPGGAAPVPATS